jgi:hypothetical protein
MDAETRNSLTVFLLVAAFLFLIIISDTYEVLAGNLGRPAVHTTWVEPTPADPLRSTP